MYVKVIIKYSCLLHWSNYWNRLYIYTNVCDLLCCFPETAARLERKRTDLFVHCVEVIVWKVCWSNCGRAGRWN